MVLQPQGLAEELVACTRRGPSEEGALAGDLNGGKEMPWDPWGGAGPQHCDTGFWNRKAPGMTEA